MHITKVDMNNKTIIYFLTLVLMMLPCSLSAQSRPDSLLTVSGIVRDESQRLPFVSVTIQGSTLGTITNEDGYFSLKIPNTDNDITIVISHVGYHASTMRVKASEAHEMRIFLEPFSNLLDAASVVSQDPERLVWEALKRVRVNYPAAPVSQRGFYRETARKGNRFISVSEAVIDMYKQGYTHPSDFDRVAVLKGRRLMSQKSSDTLSVKLQGGPVLSLSLDVVKNPNDLFYEEDLPSYDYSMETPTVIEERPVYVVRMTPRVRNVRYPLYNARVFIDRETLSIMRAEYSLDMSDPTIVSNSILRKKPAGMKFEPIGVSFIASYRFVEGKAVLHYVRGSMEFKCDWRKRLFSSSYAIVSEMVATDIRMDNVTPIQARDAFKSGDTFYDRVDDFADPAFWGDYNILEPSESLEHAVERLRRRLRQ